MKTYLIVARPGSMCALALGSFLLAMLSVQSISTTGSPPRRHQAPHPAGRVFSGTILWSPSNERDSGLIHLSRLNGGLVVSDRLVADLLPPLGGTYPSAATAKFSPAGSSALISGSRGSAGRSLAIFDLRSGRSQRLIQSGYYYATWSPDGTTLLVVRHPAYSPGDPPGALSVVDATSGRETPLTDAAWVPEWAADGRSIVFSRFPSEGKPMAAGGPHRATAETLRRQFWAVLVDGGEAKRLSNAEVDRLLGAGYRASLPVCQREIDDAGCRRNRPDLFLNSPRRGLTAVLGGVITAQGKQLQSNGFHEIPDEYAWSRLFLVGARGVVRHIDYHDNLSLLRWSADGRYLYGTGVDGTSQPLVAVDTRTGRLRQCLAGPQWEERAILDFLPTPAVAARR